MKKNYSVATPEEFSQIIEDLLGWAKDNDKDSLILALSGELGAGKTTFTQKLGEHLGVSEKITSPTFTIMSQYQTKHEVFKKLVHIDFYRLESDDELRPLRLEEVLSEKNSLICVEWPEKASSILPTDVVFMNINIIADETREVVIDFAK